MKCEVSCSVHSVEDCPTAAVGLPIELAAEADRLKFLAKNAKVKLVLTPLKQSHGVVPRTRHKGALAREHTRLSGRLSLA